MQLVAQKSIRMSLPLRSLWKFHVWPSRSLSASVCRYSPTSTQLGTTGARPPCRSPGAGSGGGSGCAAGFGVGDFFGPICNAGGHALSGPLATPGTVLVELAGGAGTMSFAGRSPSLPVSVLRAPGPAGDHPGGGPLIGNCDDSAGLTSFLSSSGGAAAAGRGGMLL